MTGYVHVKDLLEIDPCGYDQPVPARLRRPLVTIDANTALTEAVTQLQVAGSHLGRVTDGPDTLGAVTLEDALELLVGEVHDTSHPEPTQT